MTTKKPQYSDLPPGATVYDDLPQGAQVLPSVGASPSADDVLAAAGIKPLAPHAPAPVGLTSNAAGDSSDWRTRLYGNDGSQLVKTPVRHVTQALQGVAQMAMHPGKTAQAVVQQSAHAVRDAYQKAKAGDYAGAANSAADAIPVVGPWTRQVENDAHQYGVVPAMLGVGTDYLLSKAGGAATEGALTAAGAATRVATATPESMQLAATRVLAPGTAGEVLQRALKPGIKYGSAPDAMLQDTMGDVLQQNPKPQSVEQYGSAADAAAESSASRYNARISQYRPGQGTAPRDVRLNGAPIADAQMRSIPTMDLIEKPAVLKPGNLGSVRRMTVPAGDDSTMTIGARVGATPDTMTGGIRNATATTADNYRRGFDVPTLDQVRQDANAKLNAFYNKAGGDRSAALSNPETARVKAVGDTTRELLYPQIESDFGMTPGQVATEQQQYGKLAQTADIANRRDAMFSRQDPVSLAEKLATGHPGGIVTRALDFAGQKLLKNVTDSDALVRSAVDRYNNPNAGFLDTLQPRYGLLDKQRLPTRFAAASAEVLSKGARYGTYAVRPVSQATANDVVARYAASNPSSLSLAGIIPLPAPSTTPQSSLDGIQRLGDEIQPLSSPASLYGQVDPAPKRTSPALRGGRYNRAVAMTNAER